MSGLANLLMVAALGLVPDLALENTNISGYHQEYHATDYNRFRLDLGLEQEKAPDFFGKLIIDNETIYTANPHELANDTSIHRAYVQYRGSSHFWSLGRQRIPLGVGRIWNPIDLFNPINAEAIEGEERPGTDSLRYEYAIGELSGVDATLAENKGAIRLKGYLDYADLALVGLWDEEAGLDIVGWEVAGQLLATGIELRSEGGSFHCRDSGDRYTEFILGAEYGFANSLSLLAEYKYSDDNKVDYLAGLVSYQPAMLLVCSLVALTNLDDNSGFLGPALLYSLSDEMTLTAGAFIYFGSTTDEFALLADRYYLRWFVHF